MNKSTHLELNSNTRHNFTLHRRQVALHKFQIVFCLVQLYLLLEVDIDKQAGHTSPLRCGGIYPQLHALVNRVLVQREIVDASLLLHLLDSACSCLSGFKWPEPLGNTFSNTGWNLGPRSHSLSSAGMGIISDTTGPLERGMPAVAYPKFKY